MALLTGLIRTPFLQEATTPYDGQILWREVGQLFSCSIQLSYVLADGGTRTHDLGINSACKLSSTRQTLQNFFGDGSLAVSPFREPSFRKVHVPLCDSPIMAGELGF